MPFDDALLTEAKRTLQAARDSGAQIVTAESCTGGLVAAALTAVPGSSDVVDGGTVTYSNAAKMRLGVPGALIETHGAVSREVAEAMVRAALENAPDGALGIAVTGVAGPGGGSPTKPVGLVHIAAGTQRALRHHECRFGDVGRATIRRASVVEALRLGRAVLVGDGA